MTDKMIYIYIVGINVITFVLFAVDKKRAVHRKWRIRERTLLGCSFLGGAPGGLLAMHVFHHKTQKPKFSIGVPVFLAVQAVLLGYLIKTGIWPG